MRTSFSVMVLMFSALATGDLAGGRLAARQAAGDAPLTCATADSRLRACLTFDGDSRDRSWNGNHAHAGNVSYVPGKSGQAARFNEKSRMLIAQSPSLELQQLTVKFWVRPAAFPTGPGEEPRMGLIDGEATFRMYIQEKGIVRCSLTGARTRTRRLPCRSTNGRAWRARSMEKRCGSTSTARWLPKRCGTEKSPSRLRRCRSATIFRAVTTSWATSISSSCGTPLWRRNGFLDRSRGPSFWRL